MPPLVPVAFEIDPEFFFFFFFLETHEEMGGADGADPMGGGPAEA